MLSPEFLIKEISVNNRLITPSMAIYETLSEVNEIAPIGAYGIGIPSWADAWLNTDDPEHPTWVGSKNTTPSELGRNMILDIAIQIGDPGLVAAIQRNRSNDLILVFAGTISRGTRCMGPIPDFSSISQKLRHFVLSAFHHDYRLDDVVAMSSGAILERAVTSDLPDAAWKDEHKIRQGEIVLSHMENYFSGVFSLYKIQNKTEYWLSDFDRNMFGWETYSKLVDRLLNVNPIQLSDPDNWMRSLLVAQQSLNATLQLLNQTLTSLSASTEDLMVALAAHGYSFTNSADEVVSRWLPIKAGSLKISVYTGTNDQIATAMGRLSFDKGYFAFTAPSDSVTRMVGWQGDSEMTQIANFSQSLSAVVHCQPTSFRAGLTNEYPWASIWLQGDQGNPVVSKIVVASWDL